MKKNLLFLCLFFLTASFLQAQIGVDKTNTYLVTKKDGKPFFWLADTGWELFHRLTREEAMKYLDTRRKQGFNVIMAVTLAENNGLKVPNMYGDVPFSNLETLEWDVTPGSDPKNAKEYDYWDNMDFVIREADKRNMYIGLLPTWGDKVAHLWGEGPIVFNPDNAYTYAKKLAERYKDQWNIIWILGGDRPAVYDRSGKQYDDRPVWRAMAQGIRDVYGNDVFIAYHPSGGGSTVNDLNNESWLSMNALQSGHGSRTIKPWEIIAEGLKAQPRLPIIDLEPCYEDHPVNPWDNKWTRAERGYFDDYDVRARMYRGVFAGGAGATYGHHHIWQFLDTLRNPPIWVGDTIIGWKKALTAKAANQIHHLKELMLSHPDFNRVEDNSLVASDQGSDYTDQIIATRNEKATYALVYLPQPKRVKIDLDKLKQGRKKIAWFNPVTGKYSKVKEKFNNGIQSFTPPNPQQKDWVLVVEVK